MINIEESPFYKRLIDDRKTHHGRIGAWMRRHPDFSIQELLTSGVGEDCYIEEVAAYAKFFREIDELKAGKKCP